MTIQPTGDTQYSLTKNLTIWALVAIPMPILAFIVAPAWAETNGLGYGITVWLLMIVGMVWQFILSMIILYRELDAFTWANIKSRIWLNRPTNPKTRKSSYKYFWWLIPAFLAYALIELTPVAEIIGSTILIPTVIDQNPCAHLRMPRDMIFHGWSMRLFQAWQHSATMSS